MIAHFGFTGTAATDYTTPGNNIWYEDSWSYDETSIEVNKIPDKALLIIKNAIKAIETVVRLGKRYRLPVWDRLVSIPVKVNLKMLFSRSGRLSNRIRRIRKSR